MNAANEKTIKAALCGAKGFKDLVDANDGFYVCTRPEGRVFRGSAATVAAVKAENFDVAPWTGPVDSRVFFVARAKAASRAKTFVALTPVGALVV